MPKLSGLRPSLKWPFFRRPASALEPDTLLAKVEAVVDPSGKRAAQVAPAVILATGAGAALLWWTQWARGRAESEMASGERGPDDLSE